MKYEIALPELSQEVWKQISGDMDPGKYGGAIAKLDGESIEVLEFQPIRECIGDKEAVEVGFPWWTREGYFDLNDLCEYASNYSENLYEEIWDELTPAQRGAAVLESIVMTGWVMEEGPFGWAEDIVPEKVEWWSGEIAGPEYFADEEESFRIDILGERRIFRPE